MRKFIGLDGWLDMDAGCGMWELACREEWIKEESPDWLSSAAGWWRYLLTDVRNRRENSAQGGKSMWDSLTFSIRGKSERGDPWGGGVCGSSAWEGEQRCKRVPARHQPTHSSCGPGRVWDGPGRADRTAWGKSQAQRLGIPRYRLWHQKRGAVPYKKE